MNITESLLYVRYGIKCFNVKNAVRWVKLVKKKEM